MKKKTNLLLAGLLALVMAAGCGESQKKEIPPVEEKQEEVQEEKRIEKIVIGTTSVIETATRDEYAFDMLASGTSEIPLVCQDPNGEFQPLLAEFETEDSATWTYKIVDGMKWSDGEPVTAEDILFSLEYADANGSANLVEQTDSEGKVTPAKYTGYSLSEDKMSISLTLARPNVRELSNMTSFRVMPKHVYEGKETVTEEEARIGCGPYKFQEFNKEAGTISFIADSNYPEEPNVDQIVYQIFSNEDTMYMALQSGDIDMVWNYSTGVSATYQDVLASAENVTMVNVPAANEPAVLAFNNAKGLFADKNMREVVANVLDYEVFKEYFGSAYSQTPNRGFVPTTTVGYKETPALKKDLKKAESLMAEAGYTEKNQDGFYVNGEGNPVAFSLTVNAGKENHIGYAELIKTNLEEFGIQVNLDTIDKDSFNAKTSNKFSENNITMEAAIYGYTAAGMGMGNGLGTIYVDGKHPVQGGAQVFDENFQTVLTQLSAATSLEEYKAGAAKVQEYYSENLPVIALFWDNMMYVYDNQYENVVVDYTFGLNNVNNWFSITEK